MLSLDMQLHCKKRTLKSTRDSNFTDPPKPHQVCIFPSYSALCSPELQGGGGLLLVTARGATLQACVRLTYIDY